MQTLSSQREISVSSVFKSIIMNEDAYNQLSGMIIHSAIEVHKALGPGLLESVYEKALIYELSENGLYVKQQVPITINYKGLNIENGYFADVIVEDKIILELKAVENILPIHKAQLLSYLKLSGLKLGLLINFHEERVMKGLTRVINGYL